MTVNAITVFPTNAEIITLPTFTDVPFYSYQIVLSGVSFTLTLRYNQRMARWLMDIVDSLGTPLVSGLPLLIGRNLTGRFVQDSLPAGMPYVTDDTHQSTQPERDSFGTSHSLRYYDPTGTT